MQGDRLLLDRRLLVNSYDRTPPPPDDVGRQKGVRFGLPVTLPESDYLVPVRSPRE